MKRWIAPLSTQLTIVKDNLNVTRRVAGALLVASKQPPLHIFGNPELEAFVSTTDGVMEKSKTQYIRMLLALYETISQMTSEETGNIGVARFTYDSWSAAMSHAISD